MCNLIETKLGEIMYIWHLMIYKQNFTEQTIDDFFAYIHDQRDYSGLHFKKMHIDGNTRQTVLATLWFEPENQLSQDTLEQIIKFMYTQLLAGVIFELPTFARILREDLPALGIEFTRLQANEYNLTFWGVPTAEGDKSKFEALNKKDQQDDR